jgi:hypothetical protein
VYGTEHVAGDDPYALDADHDGWGLGVGDRATFRRSSGSIVKMWMMSAKEKIVQGPPAKVDMTRSRER